MTDIQKAFIQAQQNLVNLSKYGKKAYDNRYQAAVRAERVAKTNLIAEQALKDSYKN